MQAVEDICSVVVNLTLNCGAMAKLWGSWGFKPPIVFGSTSGIYTKLVRKNCVICHGGIVTYIIADMLYIL